MKGFVLDDERIRPERAVGQDYCEELLERIRDIRASERLLPQKLNHTLVCYRKNPYKSSMVMNNMAANRR